MNHQRINTFLILPSGLARYSQKPKLKRSFEILWVLLIKSQFSTLTDLNPVFGRPWDMLGIFFVNFIFIALQKKSSSIFFLNSMLGFKSTILVIFYFWQNGTFEPVHGIQKKMYERLLCEEDIYKKYPWYVAGFTKFQKFFSILVPVNT